jgi:hypothetical protein
MTNIDPCKDIHDQKHYNAKNHKSFFCGCPVVIDCCCFPVFD